LNTTFLVYVVAPCRICKRATKMQRPPVQRASNNRDPRQTRFTLLLLVRAAFLKHFLIACAVTYSIETYYEGIIELFFSHWARTHETCNFEELCVLSYSKTLLKISTPIPSAAELFVLLWGTLSGRMDQEKWFIPESSLVSQKLGCLLKFTSSNQRIFHCSPLPLHNTNVNRK